MHAEMASCLPWGSYRPTAPQQLLLRLMQAGLLRGSLRKTAMRIGLRRGARYDIKIGNILLRCRFGDNATESGVLMRGVGSNHRGLAQLLGVLRPGDVFVDVGANFGLFTTLAADTVGPSGCVIAIEPTPAMISRLTFNMKANRFTNIIVFEAAVGDVSGTAVLNVLNGNYGRSSLEPRAVCLRSIPVRMMTLAEVVGIARVDRIDALKIDVENFEDKALLPYISLMPQAMWPRHILIELVHSQAWRTNCVQALGAAGYQQVWTDGRDSLMMLKHRS
jgi:FkbM family methyltransferase